MKYNFSELSERHKRYFVKLQVASGIEGWGRESDIILSVHGVEIDVMKFLDALVRSIDIDVERDATLIAQRKLTDMFNDLDWEL